MRDVTDRLRSLGLKGMAEGLEHQFTATAYTGLAFEQRLAHLIDAEIACRENRRLSRILKGARLKVTASPEDILYRGDRGLDRALVADLLTCRWVAGAEKLVITGPTGTGKTWLACAFGTQAARKGYTVRYALTNQLLEELALAHQDGSIGRHRTALAKVQLLILDEFGIAPLTQQGKLDLLQLLDARQGATILAGQLPFRDWHQYIDDPSITDAVLDRLRHEAHRLQLEGESLRKLRARTTS